MYDFHGVFLTSYSITKARTSISGNSYPVTFCYNLPNYQLYLSDFFSRPSRRPSTIRYDLVTRCCPTNHGYYASVPQGHAQHFDQPTKPPPTSALKSSRLQPTISTTPQPICVAIDNQSQARKQQGVNVSGICGPKIPAFSGTSFCSGCPAGQEPSPFDSKIS